MINYATMTQESPKRISLEERLHEKVGEAVLGKMNKVSLETVATEKTLNGNSMSLYIHIPFCAEICAFCAFHRRVGNGEQREEYVSALETHVDETLPLFGKSQKVSSIYFGGGTPGLLTTEQAGRIISRVGEGVDISGTPITYELHPENITREYVAGLQDLGVERFSIGVQNLSDSERQVLGRSLTTGDQDIKSLQVLNGQGAQYNIDLIFGTPTQTMVTWRDTVERIVDEVLPPEITLYQYVNAHGSETKKLLAQGLLERPDLRGRYAMYEFARRYLASRGYTQTNTQSFSHDTSKPKRPLLNQGGDFLGIGPKTYSRIGRYIFINDARTSDFKQDGDTADYYGIKLPAELVKILDRGFALFARQGGDGHRKQHVPDLGIFKSEAITQAYGVLYYINNQPRMQSRLATAGNH